MGRVTANDRRQAFVEAAVQVIGEHGVSGATTRRIAAAADAPLASLHYCFHSKQELLMAVFQYIDELIIGELSRSDLGKGIGSAASALLTTATDWYTANSAHARTQFDLYRWMLGEGGASSDVAKDAYRAGERKCVKIIRACKLPHEDDGMVVPLVRLVFAMVDGLILAWLADRDTRKLNASIKMAVSGLECAVDHGRLSGS
ncbi:TetR family transcriptional regulator [Prauserella endophytica]|uniref:TetR/AcrR family transcriptional regulator n=1 Tax=Prauserella endophytica TaxID=1592324 RepID=A0ABY2S4R2_9PSEU|nr:TetR family transcriptional regulator [Prauserella endophytica]TKG70543.1 TetR/AcrR family transcriptional regulator [Prauserella endophytica]